jgi:hypothetical protein
MAAYFKRTQIVTCIFKKNEMIQKKKHLAEMTVSSSENWIGKLSNKELRELFG